MFAVDAGTSTRATTHDVRRAAGDFEVDEGNEAERADLEALIAAADGDAGDWSDGVAAVADLDEMTRMWAVEKYIGHWDGYAGDPPTSPNNYYLHSDAAGVHDAALGHRPDLGRAAAVRRRGGLLFDRCLGDEAARALGGGSGCGTRTRSTCAARRIARDRPASADRAAAARSSASASAVRRTTA